METPALSLPWSWVALNAGLLVSLGFVVVRGLKFLERLDGFRPPVGARRVGGAVTFGEPFPLTGVPEDLAAQVLNGTVVFVFSGPGCCVCEPVVSSLPFLARDYERVQFVLLTLEPWQPFTGKGSERIRNLQSTDLVEELGLMIQPYAIKTVDGRVRDFGVVNTPEHLESLLESPGRAAPAKAAPAH